MEDYTSWMPDVQQPFKLDETTNNISLEIEQPNSGELICTKKNSCEFFKDMLENCQPHKNLLICCLEIEWMNVSKRTGCFVIIKGAVNKPKLTLTLPVSIANTESNSAVDHGDHKNGVEVVKLTSSKAVTLLRKANFNFSDSFWGLAMDMGLDFQYRKQLKKDGDMMMATEEAIEWWIKNSEDPTWDKFIVIVRACEKNTANNIKAMLSK
jgi:hypothetical protein